MPPQQNENGHRQMPLAESDRRQSRLEDIREDLHSLFSGRPSVAARSPSPESPKAPRLVGLDNLPSTRIHIPGLTISQSSTRRNSTAAEPTLPRHEETSLPLVASRSASRISQSMQLPAVSSPISTIPPGVQRRSDLTIFFCHSLIRLCMMVISPPIEGERDPQRLPSMVGPGGYAETSVPIRVALARDEEAAGIESQATKVPPPAYGLWRESVRVDPNRIFWQRNEAALNRPISRISERSSMGNRPPSYMSDDGIDYVIEAAPRSTVSGEDISPRHPADRSGRHRV
ncbi:hypothetical protein SS1G_00968 [Sclerotinia sclerotiorum 1980 UF-70]|uniref:Uncharacterized protein n=1 Tax=Sclerotinia sclerotiorum (strain ATCC 18683 / 1980 / Ss-1) TaxID=665079 RepID=A7E6P3_SCLS1|nr:hypothetical protein SS1G_00968 [Sclerotinia sclerotiorum 1980 UF-70]EDN91565.1 hypothetical protein SS1G_00968 [Sclerotinia sclerotiorum 1980 UF-70]